MRRADRLFRIVQRLRRRGATTARQLAEALEVSGRTVYRDIRDLLLSGVPIQGEAGVGYALDRSYELPPLMFDEEEIEALVLGARIVRAWADKKLARAAEEALQKIETVLPPKLKSRLAESALMAPGFHLSERFRFGLEDFRRAIRASQSALPLRRQGAGGKRARGPPARACVLGTYLDARRLVRDAKRLPQLPAGPDRRAADSRGSVRGRAGADARRLPCPHGRRGASCDAQRRTSMSDRGEARLSSRA